MVQARTGAFIVEEGFEAFFRDRVNRTCYWIKYGVVSEDRGMNDDF